MCMWVCVVCTCGCVLCAGAHGIGVWLMCTHDTHTHAHDTHPHAHNTHTHAHKDTFTRHECV